MHNVVKTPAFGSQPGAGTKIHSRRGKKQFLPAALAAATLAIAPVMSAVPAHAAPDPSLTVSPELLDPEAENTISIAGSNYSADGPGVYVGVGPEGIFDTDDFHTRADFFDKVDFVNDIDDSGDFTRDISLSSPIIESAGEEINCLETQCGIYTIAAHGSSDRSQDTYQPIVFSEVDDNDGDYQDDGDGEGDDGADQDGQADDGDNESDDDDGSDADGDGADASGEDGTDDSSDEAGSDADAGSDETGDNDDEDDSGDDGTDTDGSGSDGSDEDTGSDDPAGDNPSGDESSDDSSTTKPKQCLAGESGSLNWGIYDEFRSYVEGPIADGAIKTSGVKKVDGNFQFPLHDAAYNFKKDSGTIDFSGSVTFTGHGGDLDITFANPQIDVNGSKGTLIVDVTDNTNDGKTSTVNFADLSLGSAPKKGDSASWSQIKTTLTKSGSAAMQDSYNPGQTIDPASFTISGSAADCGSTIGPQKRNTTAAPVLNIPGKGSTPAAAQDNTDNEPVKMCQTAGSASLTWGVKKSFTDYVTGPIADGSISPSGVSSGGNGFGWSGSAKDFDLEKGVGQVAFSGSVSFSGHDDALNLRIANPRIDVTSESAGVLYADVKSTNPAGEVTIDASSVKIATLNLSGKKSGDDSSITYSAVPATLTAEGVPAFAEFYDAGSALDPITFTVGAGAEVPCDELDSLPRTGSDLDLALAGGAFIALGALVVAGVRRRKTQVSAA